MRRTIFCILVLISMTFCIAMVQADDQIKVQEKYILITKKQLMEIQAWITRTKQYMNQLLTENVALKSENENLKQQLEKSKKGLFLGGNMGLPLGGDAIILYQFGKSGIYSQVGYKDGFNINIGYMRKLK